MKHGHGTGADARSPEINLRREQGYALLVMLLFVSLLVVTLAAVAPTIASQIRRDQETELIRRGMQYRRAIRQFTKKTGRFPMKIEDLEGTNGVRYLRKRYKDPLTGGEFRLLHMADIPSATGISSNAWSLQAGANADNPSDGSTSPPGQDSSANTTAQNSQPASSPSGNPSPQGAPQPGASSFSSSNSASTNNTFGGGVIVGVASASKKKTIREFDHRNHYNQWLFFYDPGFERPFEVQGPTPTTHPPVALQTPPTPSGNPPSPSNNPPNSSNQNAPPSPPPQ